MKYDLDVILEKIKNKNLIFRNYTEFLLKKTLNIKNNHIKDVINNFNKESNIICLYNKKTYVADLIGVVDINNVRYIDFDDNQFTLTNKGIDYQINDYIN